MRTNLLVLILAFFLFPLSGWGQEETVINLSSLEYSGGYTINTDGTYRFIGKYTGTPTQKINDDGKVGRKAVINIGLNAKTTTIILDGVDIDLNNENYCPLFAGDATMVTLQLKGENKLLALQDEGNCPGIWAPEGEDCELKIESYNKEDKDGILNVRGGGIFAGIGIDLLQGNNMITINSGTVNAEGGTNGYKEGDDEVYTFDCGSPGIEVLNDNTNSTTLTINGGIITATGTSFAAGIGGGVGYSGGTCTITGGTVTAKGGKWAAGIGGDAGYSGGTCIITGGTVTVTGGKYAAGIGGGYVSSGSTCIITGGAVTATGGEYAAGIGDGNGGSGGIFTTTKDSQKGNAFIIASSISDQNNTGWSGIIFEGNDNGKVYGTSIILSTNAEIPEGKTLIIDDSQTLIIKDGISLSNKGTITNNGKILLVGSGKIEDNQPATNNTITGFEVTYKSNYTDGPEEAINYIAKNEAPKYEGFSRQYYTFDDWYDATGGDTKVEQIVAATTVYAHWKPNEFAFKSSITKQILIQNEAIEEINLSTLLEDNAITNCGKMTYEITSTNLPEGLSLNKQTGIISGIPTETTEGEVSVIIKATAINTSEAEITIPFEVKNIDVIVSSTPSPNENGWYTNDITITAPAGFKIRLDNSTSLVKSEQEYTDNITWNKDGAYTLTYSLQSKTNDKEIYSRTIDIQLDKTAPTISYTKDYLNYTLTFSDINGSGIDELYIDNTLISLAETSPNSDGSITYSGSFTEAGEHIAKVIDKAGHEASCTFKLEKKPEDPVEPDDPYYPPYVPPVYYTVTLPAIEGATTDPAAGSYEVESWSSFSFLLTLDEGYQKDSHPVVTARGETLTPNASTGKYIIRNVRSDITVEISGIVKDIATGNESLSDGFHITTSGGLLLVTVPRATRLYLTDTSGRLILSRLLPAGDTRIDELAAGVYLLTLEGEGTKKILLR